MSNQPHKPAILVERARTHNLKGIDCRIPHGGVTVVTGPSGAGKSSLAFDTVFAEGQRRFVESMSTYARQFLDQMERPPVDAIHNILPAVALEAKNAVKNARSTVGTMTEIHDVLRLLYTHLGEVRCPEGHGPVASFTPEEAAAALLAGAVGDAFTLVARVPRPRRQADAALAELVRQGFLRRLDPATGEVVRLEPGDPWPPALDPLPLVLGRFRAGPEAAARIAATVEEGYRLGNGRIEARGERATRLFGRELACPVCGTTVRRPTPALFSFNSPLGACPTCQGFGRVIGIDRERVVPDPRRTLAERPIAPWNTPAYEELYDELLAAARKRRIPLDVPWQELPAAAREWVWSGEGRFVNLQGFFEWLEQRTYKVHVRVLLARYRSYNPCPTCGGTRLKPEAAAVVLAGETLPGLAAMSVEELRAWLAARRWTDRQREVAGHLLDELGERVEVLHRVGLDYLTLDRQARTLSGGETQRIHLAAALGSGLTSTLYVLDEPTIGLHPQDSGRLLALLRDLAARGNTVLVVEHDRTLIRGADHVIDLGPAAGEHGGRVVVEGPPEVVLAHPESLTGRYLRDRPATPARRHVARFRREQGRESLDDELSGLPRVVISGARAHNLKGIDVELPLGAMVAVTGVSGSGKSTLVENVIYGTYQRAQGVVDVEPGACDELPGLDGPGRRHPGRPAPARPLKPLEPGHLRQGLRRDPQALRRHRRGAGARHHRRALLLQRRARALPGLPGHRRHRGRHAVHGAGDGALRELPGAPLPPGGPGRALDRDATSPRCSTSRSRTALAAFADQRRLCRRLRVLADVGLGYLRLGQSTSTLSGGEAQRLKLASFLRPARAREGRRLFLFDEPTTGLHLADIDLLYHTLRRLVQRGDGVVVVEHSPDLIARADWIVDLGPGGGVHGGELLYSGPLEPFLDQADEPDRRRAAPPSQVAAAGPGGGVRSGPVECYP